MDEGLILPAGVSLTPLKRIDNPRGDIYHCLKCTDPGFAGFGEAYFSVVHKDAIKGWKQHKRMTMNLVVPAGEVEFYLRDQFGKRGGSVRLGDSNYQRLTVVPGVWMAFRGLSSGLNLVLNVASTSHDPEESVTLPLDAFSL